MAKIEPNYYHKGNIDTILFCKENGLDFLQGNIIKYTVRYKDKNGLEDLYKARTYLDRLIEFEEGKIMNVIQCDKCGVIISDREEIKRTLNLVFKNEFVGVFDEKHICDKCKTKLSNWLRNKDLEE